MATRTSTIGATLNLDRRGFTRDLNAATREGRSAVAELGQTRSNFSGIKSGISELGKSYGGLKAAIMDVVDVVRGPMSIHADYEDMRDKLIAIEGSAESANASLSYLTAVSNSQAMALEPLVEAQSRLVSLGYSAEQARDMIREIANAAEQAGSGAEVIAPIVGTIEKIGEKGDASVKQLMAFGEVLPVLRQILDLQFGVKTAADLDKLDLSSQQVFDGLLAGLKQVETATASANEKTLASAEFAKTKTNPSAETSADLPDRPATTESPEARAERIAAMQEAAAAKREAAARLILDKEEEIADLEISVAIARQRQDEAAINAAEEKLALARDLQKVMKDTGASEALATDAIKERVAAQLTLEKVSNPAPQNDGNFQKEAEENLAISTLRAQGKTKQADKLEAKTAQSRRQKELTDGGVDPATAKSIATQERKNTEDENRFAQTGRRRIKGAKSKGTATSFTGLDNPFADSALTPHMFDQSGDNSIAGFKPGEKMASPKKSSGSQFAQTGTSAPSSDPAAASVPILQSIADRMSAVLEALKANRPSVGSLISPTN